jgi:hypothetical protein
MPVRTVGGVFVPVFQPFVTRAAVSGQKPLGSPSAIQMRLPALVVVLVLAVAPTGPAPAPRLATEIARVRAELAAVPADQRSSAAARLDRAAAALDAGRAYLATYLMESPFELASAATFANASGVTSLDGFQRKWTDTGSPRATPAPPGERPAIVDAIAAAAEGRAPATYQASRPYAEDAGVDAGLYALGESRALVDFAAFVRAVTGPSAGRRPAFRSIAPELAAFDAAMTTRYESMARADHPSYIVASAALKQARTLNDAGRFDGALFEFLLARYLFAPLASTSGAPVRDATPERIAAARASLAGGVDHSIAELFLQLADEGVSGSVPAQRRGAAAALDDVLPTYFAAVAPPSLTAPAPVQAAATITLVRWPFT